MKQLTLIILTCCSLTAKAQSASDFAKNGIAKQNKQDYKGAIKDYSAAIKENKSFVEAYYNRGICELALKDFKSALSDLDKTIDLAPNFTAAYYSRATVFASQEKYVEALPDLDKTIKLDAAFPNALTLRGQIKAQNNQTEDACEDFNLAFELGDTKAIDYINQFCNENQQAESLQILWPESENWKIGNKQENEKMAILELVRGDETLENWTEMGTMMSIKGATGISVEQAMNLMYSQAKDQAPKAVLTLIEKDEKTSYPWIIFSIESPSFKGGNNPESQLWYIVVGKSALYTNFRAIKQASIPEELKVAWTQFFKTGKIVTP